MENATPYEIATTLRAELRKATKSRAISPQLNASMAVVTIHLSLGEAERLIEALREKGDDGS